MPVMTLYRREVAILAGARLRRMRRERICAMNQGSLFDTDGGAGAYGRSRADDLPPHNGTPTSREAAESMKGHAARLLVLVVEAVRSAGASAMTCDRAEIETGLSHQTCSARFNEAAKKGLIVEKRDAKGGIVKRPTRSGRHAVAWITPEFAGDKRARGAADPGCR